MPVLSYSFCLMDSDQGSPPEMAMWSLVSLLMSMPFWSHTSAMWKRYDGVPANSVTGRSQIMSI